MRTLHFLYHELRPTPSRYSYVTACDEFELHCELFRRLHMADDDQHLRPEVTFDDGNASDCEFALPILERHQLRAHFFITAGWTEQRPGFMGWAGLRALHVAGHAIGAHGWSHKLLTACTETELDQELRGARMRLEDGLGAAVLTMSLPGGRATARVLGACEAAGYAQVFTSVPKIEDMSTAPSLVGRLNLRSGTDIAWLDRVLRPDTGVLEKLQRADRAKGVAKTLLGDRLYAGLWSWVNRHEQETDAGVSAR